MSDAILRTLIRMFITHRHLLEWVTATQAKHAVDLKLSAMYKRMAGGVLLALAALVVIALWKPPCLGGPASVHRPLDCRSGGRVADQSSSAAYRRRTAHRVECPGSPFDFAPNLAFLRDFHHPD